MNVKRERKRKSTQKKEKKNRKMKEGYEDIPIYRKTGEMNGNGWKRKIISVRRPGQTERSKKRRERKKERNNKLIERKKCNILFGNDVHVD